MILKMKGSTNQQEQYVKDISFKLLDNSVIVLTRNITEYVIDGGRFEMVWKGVHTYTNNKYRKLESDFVIQTKWFRGAEIIDISFTDEAPKGYEFIVESWMAIES